MKFNQSKGRKHPHVTVNFIHIQSFYEQRITDKATNQEWSSIWKNRTRYCLKLYYRNFKFPPEKIQYKIQASVFKCSSPDTHNLSHCINISFTHSLYLYSNFNWYSLVKNSTDRLTKKPSCIPLESRLVTKVTPITTRWILPERLKVCMTTMANSILKHRF